MLVAQGGQVLVNRAYGIAVQRRFTPETGAPNFALGGLSAVLNALLTPDSTGRIQTAAVRRVAGTGGAQRLTYDSTTAQWSGSVDDLYRVEQGRAAQQGEPKGFQRETAGNDVVQRVFGTSDGHRAAWVRYPGRHTTILILTNDDRFDAKAAATQIAERLFSR